MASAMQTLALCMNAEIKEIERQLHELRNFLGPVELLLANMEVQITKNKAELERKIAALESRLEEHLKSTQLPTASPSPARLAPEVTPPGADLSST
jgi:DNA repair exonuclease SbcCD ATPase subunit